MPQIKTKEIHRRDNIRRYGITENQFEEMRLAQNNCCAICGKAFPADGGFKMSRPFIDHDHDTGKVRGLLCDGCNRGLGYFKEDTSHLANAANYLLETSGG
jgi:hypothetical protein